VPTNEPSYSVPTFDPTHHSHHTSPPTAAPAALAGGTPAPTVMPTMARPSHDDGSVVAHIGSQKKGNGPSVTRLGGGVHLVGKGGPTAIQGVNSSSMLLILGLAAVIAAAFRFAR
jgi:hypothetical protein